MQKMEMNQKNKNELDRRMNERTSVAASNNNEWQWLRNGFKDMWKLNVFTLTDLKWIVSATIDRRMDGWVDSYRINLNVWHFRHDPWDNSMESGPFDPFQTKAEQKKLFLFYSTFAFIWSMSKVFAKYWTNIPNIRLWKRVLPEVSN